MSTLSDSFMPMMAKFSGSTTSSGTVADTGSSVTLASGPGVEIDWTIAPLDELTVEPDDARSNCHMIHETIGLHSDIRAEQVEPIEAAALDCGIPQETIDATIEAGL